MRSELQLKSKVAALSLTYLYSPVRLFMAFFDSHVVSIEHILVLNSLHCTCIDHVHFVLEVLGLGNAAHVGTFGGPGHGKLSFCLGLRELLIATVFW